MIGDPPSLAGAVHATVADVLPAVSVPMVGAEGGVSTGAAELGAPGEPPALVDSAQLDDRLLSDAGSTSASDGPPVACGQPAS